MFYENRSTFKSDWHKIKTLNNNKYIPQYHSVLLIIIEIPIVFIGSSYNLKREWNRMVHFQYKHHKWRSVHHFSIHNLLMVSDSFANDKLFHHSPLKRKRANHFLFYFTRSKDCNRKASASWKLPNKMCRRSSCFHCCLWDLRDPQAWMMPDANRRWKTECKWVNDLQT